MLIDNRNNNINFGYKIAVDIGASVAGGSFKIKLYNNGNVIDEFSKHLSPGGVKNSQEFVTRIADSIAFMQNMAKNAIESLPTALERSLEDINIFICGRPEKAGENLYSIKRIRNIKSLNTGESLANVDFSPLDKRFGGTKIQVFNDMIGAVCAGLNRISADKVKDSSMFITTGGGCGVSYIKKVKIDGDNYLQVTESRDGRRLIHGEPLEVYGASVSALIRNFLSKQDVSQETVQELLKVGDARIALNESPVLAQKHNLAISKEGTKFALTRFIDSVSECIKLKCQDGEDLQAVMLSGKLMSGINDFLLRNADTDLRRVISSKLGKYNPEIRIIEGIKDNVEGAMFLENKSTFTKMSMERDLPVLSLLIKQ